jgi:hypothetical protein
VTEGRVFEAKYRGRCACGCDGTIQPGDGVTYTDGLLLLADCATGDAPVAPARRERPPCPSCWLVHAGSCEDAR